VTIFFIFLRHPILLRRGYKILRVFLLQLLSQLTLNMVRPTAISDSNFTCNSIDNSSLAYFEEIKYSEEMRCILDDTSIVSFIFKIFIFLLQMLNAAEKVK
jgi:hypothetical protein